MRNKIILLLMVLFLFAGVTIEYSEQTKETAIGAFNAVRSFTAPQISNTTQAEYYFGVVDIPTERAGAASSSTGFEFGKFRVRDHTSTASASFAFTVASTSEGFAFTVNESGKIKGCTFDLNALPTTGNVSVQIQKNGTLQTGEYCKLPRSGTFATQVGLDDLSSSETITDEITFVAGDRFGLIASSSGLNAATVDGFANLIIQLNN